MASPLPIDPYEVLNVSKDASIATIRSAHRKLALKFHPDRIKDEAERQKGSEEFQKAQQAYELLSDDKRRARYDDQVKLASLRRETTMMDRGNPVRTTTSYPMSQPAPPRTTASTNYEYRDGRMYEERRPRYSDDDDRYAEPPRASARKASGYERRPSTAHGEEKKKKPSSGFSAYMESKLRTHAQHARERASHTETAKSRDKERRREASDKYSRSAYVEDDSSSESDTVTYVSRKPEPKRRTTYTEAPKKSKDSTRKEPRKNTRDTSSDTDDWESRDPWADRHTSARDYIQQRNGRPGMIRSDAVHYISPRERSSGKSGSDRDQERPRSSKAARPHIEVVEPPRRSPQSRKAAPPMPTAKSSPAGLKIPASYRDVPQPQRSTTNEYPREHSRRDTPSMNRSNTMPNTTSSRKDAVPGRSSKLKHAETHDSGYGSSSPNTPVHYGTSPPKSSTKYFIVDPDEQNSRHRTVPVYDDDDEHTPRRTRSPSPIAREKDSHRDRKSRPERPSINPSASYAKGSRSTSYAVPMSPDQTSPRPNLFRNESSRSTAQPRDSPTLSRGDSGRSHLYGEIPREEASYRIPTENIRYAQGIDPSKAKYSSVRRGSADVKDRDYFPGSHHESRHGRRESVPGY